VTFVDWADVTRWKVINKMLDLPFDNPPETYSTSEHFFHDMGIAPGTKGRLRPERPAEPRPATKPAGRRSGSQATGPAGERTPREDRPRRGRSRTRSGQPVDASQAAVQTSAPSSVATATQDGAGSGDKPARSRNRRRRNGSEQPARSGD
jgi:hypothetical protein